MFNSGGAVEQCDNISDSSSVTLKVRGCGRFGAYSSQRPLKCTVGGTETDFDYESATGLVSLSIPLPEEEMYRWTIEIKF